MILLARRITNDLSVTVNSGIIFYFFCLHNYVVAPSRQMYLVNSTYKIRHQATNKLLEGGKSNCAHMKPKKNNKKG